MVLAFKTKKLNRDILGWEAGNMLKFHTYGTDLNVKRRRGIVEVFLSHSNESLIYRTSKHMQHVGRGSQ